MPKDPIIFLIDYDSFFASVEQQDDPKLRGEPIGITNSVRSVVATASKEAKKLGVKTGMPFFEAKKICPQIIPVKGNFKRYNEIHKKSLDIFEEFTDKVEAFSIDEAFLDMTKTIKFFGDIENTIHKIKERVHEEFGSYITCSIGVGPNKLLAKLAADINKPNGFYIVTNNNIENLLNRTPLTDFCGIGKMIEQRLNKIGIYNTKQLRQADPEIIHEEFGNKAGQFLKNLSKGIGDVSVNFANYSEEPKSIGHQHTLSKNTKEHVVIKANLQKLSEMVARRLRNHKMAGRTVSICLRDSDFKNYRERKTISKHIDSSKEIYNMALSLFNKMDWDKETRLVGVTVSNLVPKRKTMVPLFSEEKKNEKLEKVLDKINKEYGKTTIGRGSTMIADRF